MKTEWREMRCVRCHQLRWPTLPFSEPYVCHRCLAVLAGKNAQDPLVTPERRAHLAKIRPKEGPFHRRKGPESGGPHVLT
jgi:hypothetical protein